MNIKNIFMKFTKRQWAIGIVVIVVVILFVVFGGNSDKGVIKIGNNSALSGSLAFLGQSDTNALILAAEEINKNGGIAGKRVEIISEDNQGDPKVAASVAQKLILSGADVIFSGRTNLTQAISQTVMDAKKPMFYSANDGRIAEQSEIFFRDSFDTEHSGVAIANEVINRVGNSRPVKIISEQSDVCQLYVDSAKKVLKGSAINVEKQEYFQSNATDLRTSITKLDLNDDDVLIACAWRHAHLLIKQLNDMGHIGTQTFQYTAPTLPVADTAEMRQLFSENNTVSTWYGFADVGNSEKTNQFIAKYKARFGEGISPVIVYPYDDMYIIKAGFEKCFKNDTLDNDCFSETVENIEYDGVAGLVTFDEKGRSNREVLMIEAEGGKWKVLE